MFYKSTCGRRGGLMVSALDSRASGPGSSPGRRHCVVFLGKTLYSHSRPLSTQVYKWVPANLMLGVTLRWTSIPFRGEYKYSLHATETGISSGLMGHLARMQTLPTYLQIHLSKIYFLQIHVLQIHLLQIHLLQIHVLCHVLCHSSFSDGIICGLHRGSFAV